MNEEINYDKMGYCTNCHKEIAEFKDGKIIGWKECYSLQLKLDSGSACTVSTCKACYDSISEGDFVNIMESIIRGWDKEIESPEWIEAQKKSYREKFYGLKIIERIK